MTIDELLELHEQTCISARVTMVKKNHDYTDGSSDPFANFRMSELLGVHPGIALLVRCMDKFKRLQTYLNGKVLQNEGFYDAIEDVINYMVLLKGMILSNLDDEIRDGESLVYYNASAAIGVPHTPSQTHPVPEASPSTEPLQDAVTVDPCKTSSGVAQWPTVKSSRKK